MRICPKCNYESMKRNGKLYVNDYEYGWDSDDTYITMWFEIGIPYICVKCGYTEDELVSTSTERY